MQKLQITIAELSTKKLHAILDQQSNAYSEQYIDFVKNELIRRGETFAYDSKTQKEIEALSDDALKTVIEKERADYNLEYIELSITEYLKRGFKNCAGYPAEEAEVLPEIGVKERYPVLRIYSGLYIVFAVVIIGAGLLFFTTQKFDSSITIMVLIFCGVIALTYLAIAESIKVFLAIEENTRKQKP